MAAAIRAEVNNGFCQTVAGRLDPAAKARLARMLAVERSRDGWTRRRRPGWRGCWRWIPVSRCGEFDRVKDVAKAASLGRFKERLDLLESIDAIGPTEVWLDGVPPGKIAHFAGEARVTDAADLKKITNEDKRLTLIVSLVHTVRTGVRDDVVTMLGCRQERCQEPR